ncbi:MAG: Ribosomal small subunit methyltransferase [Alphaproteobacteria bacterium]|nr:Ribosomal small subunit methyltransferase [Alphaproteobacteria bacterium]
MAAGITVPLNDDQAHYILRVLRLGQGDAIAVFNEISGAWQGRLAVTGKRGAVVLETQIQTPQKPHDLWLLLSPLKKEAWDFALEKATELNVGAIQPVLMEYTQNARVNEDRAKANLIEASQQCERTNVPEFFAPKKLEAVLATWDKSRLLYAALEREDAAPAAQVFDPAKPGAILIGPEGGFSTREKELLQQYDFVRPISLGPLILRAETAAIAAIVVWEAIQHQE